MFIQILFLQSNKNMIKTRQYKTSKYYPNITSNRLLNNYLTPMVYAPMDRVDRLKMELSFNMKA